RLGRGGLSSIVVGDRAWSSPRTTSSLIEDVRIYDRPLSPAEVRAHARDGDLAPDEVDAVLSTVIDPQARALHVRLDASPPGATRAGRSVRFALSCGAARPVTVDAPLRDGAAAATLPIAARDAGECRASAHVVTAGGRKLDRVATIAVPELGWRGNELGLG